MTRILGITGTRRGATQHQLRAFDAFLASEHQISASPFTEAHHGDCIGFDAEAHWLLKNYNVKVILHPPVSPAKRAYCQGASHMWQAKPYLERNNDIVDCCDVLVAAPSGLAEEMRSGTWAAVRYARRRRKLIRIIFPDGSVKVEDNK